MEIWLQATPQRHPTAVVEIHVDTDLSSIHFIKAAIRLASSAFEPTPGNVYMVNGSQVGTKVGIKRLG